MANDVINTKVQKALHFIKKVQKNPGYFLSSFSPLRENKKKEKTRALFPNALILTALSSCKENPYCHEIIYSLTRYLASQMSDDATFNYLDRNTKEYQTFRYPDDMDDTFCALSGLHLNQGTTPELLAKIVIVLTTVEEHTGGSYRTWLVSNSTDAIWKDVDLVVNANIAHFLSLQNITLPNLKRLMQKAIQTKKIVSSYYDSFFVMCYFLAKGYRGKYCSRLRMDISKQLRSQAQQMNAVDLSCAISSLCILGCNRKDLQKYVDILLSQQTTKGYWKAYGMYIHRYIDGKKNYGSSKVLTTALCVEALTRFTHLCTNETKSTTMLKRRESEFHRNVVERVHMVLRKNYSGKLYAHELMQKIIEDDPLHEVTLLTYKFYDAIRSPSLIKEDIFSLSVAHTLGWIGYTILDDFLDNEATPKNLPLALSCIRELHTIYSQYTVGNASMIHTLDTILGRIDKANYWEATHCHITLDDHIKNIPIIDYGGTAIMAEKSIGHALSSLLLIQASGVRADSPSFQLTERFFTHYLLARQRNDDAHDWIADLQRGYVNSASSYLLALMQKNHIDENQSIHNLLQNGLLKKRFWEIAIDTIIMHIEADGKKALQALDENDFIKEKSYLRKLVERPLIACQKAKAEKAQTIRFLSAYHRS